MKQEVLSEIKRIHQLMGVKKNINEGPFSKTFYEAEEQTFKKRWKEAYNAVDDQFKMGYLTKAEAEKKVSNLVDQLVGITDDAERASLRQSKIAKLGSSFDNSGDMLDSITIKIEKTGKDYAEKLKNIDNTWSELEGLIDDNMLKAWDSQPDAEGIQGLKQNLDDMVKDCKTTDPNYPGEYPLKDAYLEMYPTKEHYFTEWERYIDEIVDTTHPIPRGVSAEDQLRYKKLNDLRKQFLKNKLNDYADLDFVWYKTSEVNVNVNGQKLPVDIDYQINKLRQKFKSGGGSTLSESEKEVLNLFQKWKNGEDVDMTNFRNKIRDMKPKVPVGSEVVGKKIPLIFRKIIGPLGDWFYEHFVIWWRQWIASIRLIITGGKFDYDRFSTIFYKGLNEAIQNHGSKAQVRGSTIMQIVNALETAPAQLLREGGGFITGESPLYKEIWEKFKMEGAEHFKGKTAVIDGKEVSLENAFKNFCDQIENYKSDHPIMKDKKFGGLKSLMEGMDEAGEETVEKVSKNSEQGSALDVIRDFDKTQNFFTKLAKDAWNYVKSNVVIQKIYTFFRGGNFKTPKDFTDYLTNKFKQKFANESPERLQKKIFGIVGTPQAIASTWLMKRAFVVFIVIPTIFATVQFIYDCYFLGLMNIKGQTKQEGYFFDEDDDKVTLGTWGNYVIYRIVEEAFGSSMFMDGLEMIGFETDSNGQSWSNYIEGTLSLLPGFTEAPVIWLANHLDDAKKGNKTKQERTEELYEETSKDFSQVTLDSANKKLEEPGIELRNELGEDPNNEKWEKFFLNRGDMDLLYAPKYREGTSIWELLVEDGIITNSDKNRILKEKELRFGLNPAYMYENRDKINANKMQFINKLKNLQLKDLVITQEESLNFGKQISGVISDVTNSPGASKANPFMLVGKDGKKYILKNLPSEERKSENGAVSTEVKLNAGFNPNTIQFYTPDYKTLYDAIYDPKKILVPAEFKIPSDSKLTEQNLVRVSLNPITKF